MRSSIRPSILQTNLICKGLGGSSLLRSLAIFIVTPVTQTGKGNRTRTFNLERPVTRGRAEKPQGVIRRRSPAPPPGAIITTEGHDGGTSKQEAKYQINPSENRHGVLVPFAVTTTLRLARPSENCYEAFTSRRQCCFLGILYLVLRTVSY